MDTATNYRISVTDMTTGTVVTGSDHTVNSGSPNYFGCQYVILFDNTGSNIPFRTQLDENKLYRIDIRPSASSSTAPRASFYQYQCGNLPAGINAFCPRGTIGSTPDALFTVGPTGIRSYMAPGFGNSANSVQQVLGADWVMPYDAGEFCRRIGTCNPLDDSNFMFLTPAPLPGAGPATKPVTLTTAHSWLVPNTRTYQWSSADVSSIRFDGNLQVQGGLVTQGVALTAGTPTLGWAGITTYNNEAAGGSVTLGPGTTVSGVRTGIASVTAAPGATVVLNGATITGTPTSGAGVYAYGKEGFGYGVVQVLGSTRIDFNGGAGVRATGGARVTVDGAGVQIRDNAGGGLLASGTDARILMTEGSVLSNEGSAFLATAGGRIDILRDPGYIGGGSSSLAANDPVLADLNAGGLYATGVGKSGGVVSSGDVVCVQAPCPSIGQHNFGRNDAGPAVDARALTGSAVIGVQNYWGGRTLAQLETDVDGSSYLALAPVLATPPSAAPGGASARTADAPNVRGTGDAPGDAARGRVWTALLDADAHAQAGQGDDAARLVLQAYRAATSDDERLAASEAATRVLAAMQPSALEAWAAQAAVLPGRDRPWARRALAVALLAQGRPAEAGAVAGALAEEDGAASGPARAHRVRGRWLQIEAAIAGGDAAAAQAALAAIDVEAAAMMSLQVAVAFPDAPAPLMPESMPMAVVTTGDATTGSRMSFIAGPNPATGAVTVAVGVASTDAATVEVFDALGRSVRRLHDGPAVPPTLVFAADALPAGLYVVRAVVRHADGTATVAARTVTIAR